MKKHTPRGRSYLGGGKKEAPPKKEKKKKDREKGKEAVPFSLAKVFFFPHYEGREG